MKRIIVAASLLLLCHTISFAQCKGKLTISASKTEYLDANSVVERTVDENTVIEISNPDIIIKPGDKTMKATIKSDTCNWKIPFKEGKTILNVTFNDDQGTTMNASITIEGKEGKLTLLLHTEGRPGIIRVPIDKFEEKN
ncbi:MAG: hypothetical protein ABI760_10745 [Ferruginibacter sp.]